MTGDQKHKLHSNSVSEENLDCLERMFVRDVKDAGIAHFTVQPADPLADRSVGARAVMTNRIAEEQPRRAFRWSDGIAIDDRSPAGPFPSPVMAIKFDDPNPRPFLWSDRSDDPASWDAPNAPQIAAGTPRQSDWWHRWNYCFFEPKPSKEVEDMLAAGWRMLPEGSRYPKDALMMHVDGKMLYRPITPDQTTALQVALGKRSEADDGVTLTSISHPPEHPLYGELTAEEAAMAAQLPAPGVFETGRNQASANDLPPPAGFKRLTAEQKRDLSTQAVSDPTIYGFGLAADRGPEGAAPVVNRDRESVRQRLAAAMATAAIETVFVPLCRAFTSKDKVLDWIDADRWLSDHCGPIGSTPIKALEDGRTEKVIAYLEAAAP